MPIYNYDCPSCGSFEEYAPVAKYRAPACCPVCSELAPRDYVSTMQTVQNGCFKPYTEENGGPSPVHFGSRSDRDRWLSKKGLTYDRPATGSTKPAQNSIDYRDEVAQAMAQVREGYRPQILPTQPGETEPD